jgi:hypothetical protein
VLLDVVKWQVIRLATLRRAPDGTRLRASALRLLTCMLSHIQEQEWLDNHRLVTWPSYAEITKETALSKGSIGPARQELIAIGLITPLAGAHKRGGDDPIAAYVIHTRITRSPEQERMALHRRKLKRRYRHYKADQNADTRRTSAAPGPEADRPGLQHPR